MSSMSGDGLFGPFDELIFEPTRNAAQRRIAAVRPSEYARTRNAINGSVSRLSPYITHGFVTLPEVYQGVAQRHVLAPDHKFVYELGWREFFHHVWEQRGVGIHESLHEGVLPDAAYSLELPADIREARTGVPAIDVAVRELYATGYLHNHARMWLASYVVHLRKVHWHVGAQWLYSHLLDGDLASNHLSWQWVAATGSSKPYLFNAENVQRYAPQEWHSAGSVVDTSYEALDRIARSGTPALKRATFPPEATETAEPDVHAQPPSALGFGVLDDSSAADISPLLEGKDVWLVHPWSLRAPPADLPAGTVTVCMALADFHRQQPWSALRWQFVVARMRALAPDHLCWYGDAAAVSHALRSARSVWVQADPHLRPWLALPQAGLALAEPEPSPLVPSTVPLRVLPVERLFKPVPRLCNSFSQWWNRTALDVPPGGSPLS